MISFGNISRMRLLKIHPKVTEISGIFRDQENINTLYLSSPGQGIYQKYRGIYPIYICRAFSAASAASDSRSCFPQFSTSALTRSSTSALELANGRELVLVRGNLALLDLEQPLQLLHLHLSVGQLLPVHREGQRVDQPYRTVFYFRFALPDPTDRNVVRLVRLWNP